MPLNCNKTVELNFSREKPRKLIIRFSFRVDANYFGEKMHYAIIGGFFLAHKSFYDNNLPFNPGRNYTINVKNEFIQKAEFYLYRRYGSLKSIHSGYRIQTEIKS